MTILNPVYENIKVRDSVIETIKEFVKDGYFKQHEEEKIIRLNLLNIKLSDIYKIKKPALIFRLRQNSYCPDINTIYLENTSIISLLHEFRHAIQHRKNMAELEIADTNIGYIPKRKMKNSGLTIEQDARAWSLRIFSEACPKMFLSSVKAGRVQHIKWDETLNKVVDNAAYI